MSTLCRVLTILSILSLGGLGTKSVSAQNAQQLLSSCRPIAQGQVTERGLAFTRTYEAGVCWGAFGMLQTAIIRVDDRRAPLLSVCAPEASSRSQLVQVFVKFAESNPARLHEEGNDLAIESLQLAYPCAWPKK